MAFDEFEESALRYFHMWPYPKYYSTIGPLNWHSHRVSFMAQCSTNCARRDGSSPPEQAARADFENVAGGRSWPLSIGRYIRQPPGVHEDGKKLLALQLNLAKPQCCKRHCCGPTLAP